MKYITLLDMASSLGYHLAMCGAETFRVEEAVLRTLHAYGQNAECFSIPNLLIVTLNIPGGEPMTRIRRIGYHGNDMDGVEQYSNLSRRICMETPEPKVALQWVSDTAGRVKKYGICASLLGNFLGASGFCLFFGGSLPDTLLSGLLGILIGLVNRFTSQLHANPFFSTVAASYLMSLVAYLLNDIGICEAPNTVIIGALMILVPGLLITNAMRDVIFGDTNSGINRIVQVLLIAVAIAMGTAAAWSTAAYLLSPPSGLGTPFPGLAIELIASLIGCIGFSILFNVHGFGISFCVLGGMMTWAVYRLAGYLGCGVVLSNFWASFAASLFSECMARIRKYPAISYLVVSVFPLLPGAGIYYTMLYAVNGDMAAFASKGAETAAIAGSLAMGILLVSTAVRMWTIWKIEHSHRK